MMNDINDIKQAAEKGDAMAQHSLGFIHYKGLGGVPQDYAEALKWFLKSAEQGFALSVIYVFDMISDNRTYSVAGEYTDYENGPWFRKAAEHGYAKAQFRLGRMYENGQGVPQDDVEALKWYRKAAEKGDAEAIKALKIVEQKTQ